MRYALSTRSGMGQLLHRRGVPANAGQLRGDATGGGSSVLPQNHSRIHVHGQSYRARFHVLRERIGKHETERGTGRSSVRWHERQR
jgi:hypothetical protein